VVEGHLTLTREGRFVSGGYLRLPAPPTRAVDLEAVRTGRVFSLAWLRAAGWRPGRRALRVLPPGRLPRLLDALTPTAATWNGHNSSTLRQHLIAANGFDLDMGYGGLDRALGRRLENAGIRGQQARYRLPVAHPGTPRVVVHLELAVDLRHHAARRDVARAACCQLLGQVVALQRSTPDRERR
jgi:hypothetical protein